LLYAAEGWDDPENWGTWSTGTHATLRMRLDPVPAGPLELTLDTRVVVGPNVPQRDVAITANGHLVADATYTIASAAKTLHAEVPAGAIGADGVLELDFQTTPAASPHSAGLSEDGRKLGIGLATLAITTEGRAR
jgi:hypothetical protein